jgi:hypothetical protein
MTTAGKRGSTVVEAEEECVMVIFLHGEFGGGNRKCPK